MRRIYQCLNSTTTTLCQQTILLEKLQEKIAQFLPEDLRNHCQVAQFNKGQLILSIQNPIYATEIRYLLPKLRDKLRTEAHLYQLTSIKISIQAIPVEKNINTNIKITRKLTAKSKDCILEAAAQTKDDILQAMLLRIANNN